MKKSIFITSLINVWIGLVSTAWAFDNAAITNEAQEGLRDVKAPVYFPSDYFFIWIILAGLILGLLALLYFPRSKNKRVPEGPQDTRLPWEIALAQLDALEKGPLLKEGQLKEYYSRLSDIIREYFENHFMIRAPEMTTEEFLRSLETSRELTVRQKNTLKEFLHSCDMVKFAKYLPGLEEARISFCLAKQLIEETRCAASISKQNFPSPFVGKALGRGTV